MTKNYAVLCETRRDTHTTLWVLRTGLAKSEAEKLAGICMTDARFDRVWVEDASLAAAHLPQFKVVEQAAR